MSPHAPTADWTAAARAPVPDARHRLRVLRGLRRGALYDTGCDAPGCRGYVCYGCGTGCDIEADPEHGQCATALAAESDEDYDARIDAERAAFGLPALSQEHREG